MSDKSIFSPPLEAIRYGHIDKKAGDPTRTDDRLITNQLLYQLSYTSEALALYPSLTFLQKLFSIPLGLGQIHGKEPALTPHWWLGLIVFHGPAGKFSPVM